MSDSLGPIQIPDPPKIAPFPLTADYTSGVDFSPPVVAHVFDQPGLKTEQRYQMGPGARRFRFFRDHLSCQDYANLKAHFEQAQGQYAYFDYSFASPAGIEVVNARYENPNISFNQVVGMIMSDPGVTLLEEPIGATPYNSVATVERFPDSLLTAALLSQVQRFIPLVTIKPRSTAYTLYLSNQRVTVDGQLYLPRLAAWSGITQTMSESSDAAQFTFGNADDVFNQLANQVSLYRAPVTFSLFHVNTGYLIDLWAGAARQWSMSSDGKFILPATDGAFELTLNYPFRQLSRTCWKVYKGDFCPSVAAFTDCPKDYDSCVARGVQGSFGGVVASPQTVHIKDNTTGVIGFGRSQLTSVSIADDTIYDRTVQEVYTDEAMLVTCDVAEGRDESEFYSALGIVGEGPIGAYSPNLITHSLDGQPPHDPLHDGGWRGIVGNDPALPLEYFGIDQAPWTNIPPGSTYAGGLAFAEIRRTDAAGLQLAPVSDRAMSVTVTQGVSGWVWTAPGQRVWTPGLTNTVWIAVNVYLKARGVRVTPANAAAVPPSVQEQYFNVPQAIAAAAVCEVMVDKIIGTGQERQWPFRGVIKEQKALKDWLQEILNGALGFFTFVNGKLWIGCRTDASVRAGNAFTQASILYGSLQATPVDPTFNWLDGMFGDEEFAWALNKVTIYDIDAAGFLGTPDAPQYLKSSQTFLGISNKSQCGRAITTRLREELGGVGLAEMAAARNLQFNTTLLSLQTMVGDVVSLTHPRLPNGESKGRVQTWTLNPDFSISIATTPVTDLMYDLDSDVGPKPVDVPAAPVPPELLHSADGLAWMPNHVAPFAGDPLYPDPNERTFDLWQDYSITREGVWAPAIWISGEKVINQFAAPVQPRILNMQMGNGGHISGPVTIYAAVTQVDSTGAPSAPSNLYALWIPAGVNNQAFTLTLAAAPSGTWAGWNFYAGTDRRRLALQVSSTGNPPASFTFLGPISSMTQQLPDGAARAVAVKVKHEWHAGIAGVTITGVTAPNRIQSNDFIGAADAWVGRFISALADASDGSAPLWDFTITAFDPATGTMTVTPDCVHADPADSVQVDDVLIVRSIATAAGPSFVEDSMWNNSVARNQFNSAGLRPSEETGRIYRILRGTGAGQFRGITGNSNIRITIDTPWTTVPDATSIGVVEAADWQTPAETSEGDVPRAGYPFELRMPIANLADEVALVGGFLVDDQGNLTDEEFAVYREIYIFGEPPGVREAGPDAGPWVTLPTDQTINVIATTNDVTVQLLPLADYLGRSLKIANGAGPFNGIVQCAAGELLFDGNPSVTIGPHETVTVTAG